MNLKDFLNTRDKPPELYWSLVIEAGWIQAGIWYIGATSAEVIAVSPPTAWETDREIIGAADAALSSCVQKLPENYSEPSKTVFGVPSSWVKGGEIQDEHLADIKTLCTELSLTPVGFVVLPEAIAHLYKSEEGSPLNSVIVGLGKESLEVTVFKLGNLAGSTSVARSVSITEDVTEGLSRFEGASPLPSRIIVFDGKGGELEEAKETLNQALWDESEKVKFLHAPKVEIFPSDRKVIAVSLAGANEIGNVSKVIEKGISFGESIPSSELREESGSVTEDFSSDEAVENFTTPSNDITPENLGFAVGEDVSNTVPAPVREDRMQPDLETPAKTNYLQKTKNLFHAFSKKIADRPHFTIGPKTQKPVLGIALALMALLIILGISWWFLPKAEITVFVSPKQFTQETNISFSTGGSSDTASGIIPGAVLTAKVNGDKTKATSGTKLIGDKAKGSVTISNGNPNPINLAVGTFLTSSGGLKFVSATEASVSGQLLPGSPGTANIEVAANDIGAQYNLAKGEIFSVGNFSRSLVAGTSQSDFSGGSSQEVSAVSKDDQVNLMTELKNELMQKAMDELSEKITPDQIYINDAAKIDINSESFDRKLGDAVDNIKLSLGLTVTGIVGDNTKLLEYSRAVLKDKIPGGFVLRDSQIKYKFTFVKVTGDLYNYNVMITANFLPEENTDAIVAQIKGKTTEVTETYLNSIPGFARAEVKLNPNLPGFLGTLPRVAKNITINVVADQ